MAKYMTIGDIPIDFFTNKRGKMRHNMPTFGDHLTAARILRPDLVEPVKRKKKIQHKKQKPDIPKLLEKCGFKQTWIAFADLTRAHIMLPRIMHANQIKRDYPTATEFYYFNPDEKLESDGFKL